MANRGPVRVRLQIALTESKDHNGSGTVGEARFDGGHPFPCVRRISIERRILEDTFLDGTVLERRSKPTPDGRVLLKVLTRRE